MQHVPLLSWNKICSRDHWLISLAGAAAAASHATVLVLQNNTPPMHDDIYRRFRSEVFCRGRTASIFVTYCRAALLFWITRTVAVVIWWWDRVWFPFDVLQSWLSLKKNSGASMLMFIFLVWGMLILFMYLFLLFFFSYWLKKYYSNQNQFSAFQDLVNSLVKYIKIGAPVYFFPKSQDTT